MEHSEQFVARRLRQRNVMGTGSLANIQELDLEGKEQISDNLRANRTGHAIGYW